MEQIAENEKTPKETIPVIKVFIPFICIQKSIDDYEYEVAQILDARCDYSK
mgnify:CR=1 FL=1